MKKFAVGFTLFYALVYSGWLCHRSESQTGFIYSRSYLVFLVVAALPFLLPLLVSRLARRGLLNKILIGLIPAAAMLAVLYLVTGLVYYHRQQHLFDPFVQVPTPRMKGRLEPKSRDEFRILAIGGSTTGGDKLLNNSQRYPGVLQRILSTKYPFLNIKVFNAGQGWYTSRHTLINYVSYFQDWSPDLVIEMDGINDVVRSFTPENFSIGNYDELYTHFYGPSVNGARPPSFERVVWDGFMRLTYKPRSFWFNSLFPREIEVDYPLERYHSISPFERNLSKMIKLVRDNGSQMMLVTQPSIYHEPLSKSAHDCMKFGEEFCSLKLNFMQVEIPSPTSLGRAMNAYNNIVRKLATANNVLLCEGETAVTKDTIHFVDDVHYTPTGAEKLAAAISDSIIGSGIIERKSRGALSN